MAPRHYLALAFLVVGLCGQAHGHDFTPDFEAGYLRGWVATGSAFALQPTRGDNPTARNRGQPSGHQGKWWIGTYESFQDLPGQIAGDTQGDASTGKLTSAPFDITGDKIRFLIAGGNHSLGDPEGATAVTLVVDGNVVAQATGKNSETLSPVAWNVEAHKGKAAVLEIVDQNSGAWGHINVDDFLMLDAYDRPLSFTAEQPELVLPRQALRIAPSGPDKTTKSNVFIDVPELSTGIFSDAPGNLMVSVSAEIFGSPGKRIFMRALVDGEVADPSDVVFGVGSSGGTQSFTFTRPSIKAGGHSVVIQWATDPGAEASIGDRSLAVATSSALATAGQMAVTTAMSGPPVTTKINGWRDIPELSHQIVTSAGSQLEISFSGEVFADKGKRVFLRALVDGQVAAPSDVVAVVGGLTGTRLMRFVRGDLAAGAHSVKLQWSVDAGGTGSIGDRSLTLRAAPMTTKYGGLVAVAAPSGPAREITESRWADVPELSAHIATAANSDLEITFSGEAWASNSKRLFLRALVDGKAAEPSDVVLTRSGFDGTRSFTFAAKRLTAGPHHVQLQWSIDQGGTGFVGDRTMTLNHWQRQAPDLAEPFFSIGHPRLGEQHVLAILWDPHRPVHPAPTVAQVRDLLFSGPDSLRSYFLENSGGRLEVKSAGFLGWYDANKPGNHYWGLKDQEDLPEDRDQDGVLDPGEDLNGNGKLDGPDGIMQSDEDTNGNGKLDYDLDGDGWISGHTEKWAEAIRKADADFDFSRWDADRDGVLQTHELVVLIVIPQNTPFGTQRPIVGRQYPSPQALVVDSVRIDTMVEAYLGSPPSMGLVAHELAHIMLGAGDMYFNFFQPFAAGPYSLMDQSPPRPGHLDSFHKLKLGWLVPRRVVRTGWHRVRDVERFGEVPVLYDPSVGDSEYFVVENRWGGQSFDRFLPDDGIAVWHVIEDRDVFDNLSVPSGVNPVSWIDPKFKGWSRRGIRMIRPIYGPPIDWHLWDNSSPLTGYDLASVDPDPTHARLVWSDGKPSVFRVGSFPAPDAAMDVHLTID